MSLSQQVLDIPKAEWKAEIQPDGILDDIRWKGAIANSW
jgi:hypothetical protein